MRVILGNAPEDCADDEALIRSLARRDAVDGAWFWIECGERPYPCVAMRVSGDVADLSYFPEDGHPGFRALNSDEANPPGEFVRFAFEGCDPSSGEDVPREFVLPLSKAMDLARRFARTGALPDASEWLEL